MTIHQYHIVKFKLFQECDKLIKKEAILVSNTSSISITEIAAQTERPQQIAGMHFMNPVPLMKLVEVIKTKRTSQHTLETIVEVSKSLQRTMALIINQLLLKHQLNKIKSKTYV